MGSTENNDIRELPKECVYCKKAPTHMVELETKNMGLVRGYKIWRRFVCKEHVSQAEAEGLRFVYR